MICTHDVVGYCPKCAAAAHALSTLSGSKNSHDAELKALRARVAELEDDLAVSKMAREDNRIRMLNAEERALNAEMALRLINDAVMNDRILKDFTSQGFWKARDVHLVWHPLNSTSVIRLRGEWIKEVWLALLSAKKFMRL